MRESHERIGMCGALCTLLQRTLHPTPYTHPTPHSQGQMLALTFVRGQEPTLRMMLVMCAGVPLHVHGLHRVRFAKPETKEDQIVVDL